MKENEILMYVTEDGAVKIEVTMDVQLLHFLQQFKTRAKGQ